MLHTKALAVQPQMSRMDVFAFTAANSLRMSSASSLTMSACFRIDSSATDASTTSRVRVLPSRAPAAWAAPSSNAMTSQPRSRRLDQDARVIDDGLHRGERFRRMGFGSMRARAAKGMVATRHAAC